MIKNADKIADPLSFYKNPTGVANDDTLSVAEKIKLLENWLDDIKLRQIAISENMQPEFAEPRYYTAEVASLLAKYKSS